MTKLKSWFIKPKQKPKIDISTFILPPNLQISEQKIISKNDFIVYKWALKISNYWLIK